MIQDIFPHIFKNEYHPKKPKENDYVFSFFKNLVTVKKDHSFFKYQDLSQDNTEFIYLFEIDNTSFFLCNEIKEEHDTISVKTMRTYLPQELAFACITGWQLYDWMKNNQYCGRCSTPTVRDTKERAMRCPKCGNIIYPKLSPAVIVCIINRKKEILITHYSSNFYTHDALVAGYAEIGETIEETVHREVKEETGLNVKNLVYYKSQPWSFSQTLLFGFFCEVDGDDTIHMDQNELKYAAWHKTSDTFDLPDTASLTAEMIHYIKTK